MPEQPQIVRPELSSREWHAIEVTLSDLRHQSAVVQRWFTITNDAPELKEVLEALSNHPDMKLFRELTERMDKPIEEWM